MAYCRQCRKKLSFFALSAARRYQPTGEGKLCPQCYEPYGLVLEKYTASLNKADTDPRALAWVALCYLLAARKINLVRTITAAMVGFTETQNSWEICRQKAMELATKAMNLMASDPEGRPFVKELFIRAEKMTAAPSCEIPIQRYASVWGDTILDIEYEAVMRSGISIHELNQFAGSMPGHQWLLSDLIESKLD